MTDAVRPAGALDDHVLLGALRPAKAAAVVLILAALVVMFGWVAELSVLTQIVPTFAPMQFNTALSFLLAGAGLLALVLRRSVLVRLAAALTLLVGGLTLLEYLLGVNLRIDTLFVEPFTVVKTSHAGRMAPNTALAFVLSGLGLLLASTPLSARPASPGVLLALAAGVGGMGSLSLVGYIFGIEAAYGWAHLTRMALHTSIGFVVVGAGLILAVLATRPLPSEGVALPVAGGFVTALFTLVIWTVLEADQQRRMGELLQARTETYAGVLRESLGSDLRAMERMRDRLQTGLLETRLEWRQESESYLAHIDTLTGLGVIDDNGRLVWQARLRPGRNLSAARAAFPGKAGQPVELAVVWDSASGGELMIVMPMQSASPKFLIAFFDLRRRARSLLREFAQPLGLRVWLDGQLIEDFAESVPGGVFRRLHAESGIVQFDIYGHVFAVEQVATPQFIEANSAPTAYIMLVAGLALTVMTSAILALLQYTLAQNRRIRIKQQDLEGQIAISHELQRSLEISNQSLEEFAYVASHDLQEPLRGIRSYSRFLLEDSAAQLDDIGRERLETIGGLARRLGALINDLLIYSRVGRVDEAVTAVDLDEVITEIEITLRHQFEERNARLVRPRPLPIYRCDRVRVAEVFRNLIENALKYNDSAVPRVEVGARPGTAPVQFFVQDNGIGIAADAREKVFKIFTRLHHRDAYSGGTGAGLTIAQRIVQRHGGMIWIEDAPGGGSAFVFTLEPGDGQ